MVTTWPMTLDDVTASHRRWLRLECGGGGRRCRQGEDVKSVMKSWVNSPGRWASILGADYTMMSTSYAYSESSTYNVQALLDPGL
ncbi:hypothetical protein ON010_g12016 [Phytophthora cinnamomi]|nr:hypothetical protein ON010_g12016 [Phytophthora cinnamomi]